MARYRFRIGRSESVGELKCDPNKTHDKVENETQNETGNETNRETENELRIDSVSRRKNCFA